MERTEVLPGGSHEVGLVRWEFSSNSPPVISVMSVPVPTTSLTRSPAHTLMGLWHGARPKHWIKNFPVFAAVVFSPAAVSFPTMCASAASFVSFCLIASAVYLLNDLCDIEEDRLHPQKKWRPLAAGVISIGTAATASLLMASCAIAIAFAVGLHHGIILLTYFAVNVAYSLRLKRQAGLDVFLIGAGFVLRAVAGAAAIAVYTSGWLIVTTLSLSMFIGFTKRRSELQLLGSDATAHRACLSGYSLKSLNQLILTFGIASAALYAAYTIAPSTVSRFGTYGLFCTLPMVAAGLWRFAMISCDPVGGSDPATLIFHDRTLIAIGGLWLITACAAIYGPTF